MKRYLLPLLSAACLGLTGCNLPVPKTTLRFDPATRSLDIRSPKDVQITNVMVKTEGTNFTMQIGSYSSKNSVEVIKAAVQAQKNQINGALAATDKLIEAASSLK